MRSIIHWSIAALLVAAAACGGDEGAPGPARDTGVEARPVAPTPAAPGPPPAKERDGLEYRGTATPGQEADSDAGAGGEIELAVRDDGGVSGELLLGGVRYRARGELSGDELRCWLSAAPREDGAHPRRGTLIGARRGESLEGSYAVAGHGGADPLRGSWKASAASGATARRSGN